MKALLLVPIFPLLAWSVTPAAGHQALNAPKQATTLQTLVEDHLLSSDAAADVRSVVLKQIANVTASLTEGYLRDLIALGIAAFGVSENDAFQSSLHLMYHSSSGQ